MSKEQRLEKAYSSPWWWYDIRGFFILTFCYQNTLFRQLQFFSKGLSSPHLECAIGSGSLFSLLMLTCRITRRAFPERIFGFDYEERMLLGAKLNFACDSRIKLSQQDVGRTDYQNDFFNSVNIANAIHSFPDPDLALKEVYRVTAPGGIIRVNALLYPRGVWPLKQIAQALCDWGIRKGILVSPFEQEEIHQKFIAAGFIVDDQIVSRNCVYIVAHKPR